MHFVAVIVYSDFCQILKQNQFYSSVNDSQESGVAHLYAFAFRMKKYLNSPFCKRGPTLLSHFLQRCCQLLAKQKYANWH